MNEHVAQYFEEGAWERQRQDEANFLALGLPQLPMPDGKGDYSEQQMYDYALLDRMRDFLAMTREADSQL